jgi:molecular chaperone IbpA
MSINDILPKNLVGFEQLFRQLEGGSSSYPPHNLIRLKGGENFIIETAVAGFQRDEIEVTLEEQNKLTISAKKKANTGYDGEYIYHSLAHRQFTKRWVLADDIRVESVQLEHGILTVRLTKFVPETKRSRRLEIK